MEGRGSIWNRASLNTGVAQHQRHCDKHITSCPAYARSSRLYTYMYIQRLTHGKKGKNSPNITCVRGTEGLGGQDKP